GKKGAAPHRKAGFVFSYLMYVTALMAVGMSVNTILAPEATHPHLSDRDPEWIRNIFGWLMVYLAILTISLVRHGLQAVRHKRDHAANRTPFDVGLQLLVIAAALHTAWRGSIADLPLLMGMSIVGIASGATNLFYIFRPPPARHLMVMEHLKALVGAGISVYTAFLAFGFVRLMPQNALNPKIWAIPLVVGLTIIIYHQARLLLEQRALSARTRGTARAGA
nr:hypothetical protein [Gemmatimonadaceae bacterium]